jgi:hypothetical protein
MNYTEVIAIIMIFVFLIFLYVAIVIMLEGDKSINLWPTSIFFNYC